MSQRPNSSSKSSVHCEAILWPWYSTPTGKHPIKIRVTHNRKRKYFSVKVNNTNLFLDPKEWEEIQDHSRPLRGDKKQSRAAVISQLANAEQCAQSVTQHGKPFTFDRFENVFLTKDTGTGFIKICEEHLRGIFKEGRIGTFRAYNNSLQAFKKFRDNKELDCVDVTPDLLRNFESFLVEKEHTRTTVGMYLRALKVFYNVAASKYPSLAEFYPFAVNRSEKNKFRIKQGSGKKGEALSSEQIKKFLSIETIPGSPMHEARQLWLFSFYAQGMNFRDMAFLTWQNIEGDVISYIRSKTKNTENRVEKMQVPINEPMRKVIDSYSSRGNTTYVFGILEEKVSVERQDALIRQKIKTTNKWLSRICKENFLPEIKTYWARHSYASLLKSMGESVDLIREMLGHSDIRTTESYLKGFDLERKKSANQRAFESLL